MKKRYFRMVNALLTASLGLFAVSCDFPVEYGCPDYEDHPNGKPSVETPDTTEQPNPQELPENLTLPAEEQ